MKVRKLVPAARPDRKCSRCKKPATLMHQSKSGNRYYYCAEDGRAYLKEKNEPSKQLESDHYTEADYQTWMRL